MNFNGSLELHADMSLFEIFGSITAVVALFGYINHRFIKLPDTIGITVIGLLASLILAVFGHFTPGVTQWAEHYANNIDFSEVVLHGMLGVLLFAGSLHVSIKDLSSQKVPVFLLSTVGVILSMVFTGYAAHWVLAAFDIHVSLTYCLLFGALISPTDPVAVLGLLKNAGVPKTLETKISGESLFNDGTSVVAFLVLLGIATGAQAQTPASIASLLMLEVVGGIVLGLAVGFGASYLVKGIDSYALEILITVALATGGYALAERMHVSATLAVVVIGLVIGNHGATTAMTECTRERLFAFWDMLDELLNLVLFGLIGLKLLSINTDDVSWLAAFAMLPIVLIARLFSVGLPIASLRPWLTPSRHTVKIMTWGGLRGGISIALVLSLPQFESKDLFVVATYVVVLFSLLIQAPTLGRLIHHLNQRDAALRDKAAAVSMEQ